MSNWWKQSKYDPDNPPEKVRHLSPKQQRKWVHVYNSAADDGDDEETAHKKAWGSVNDSEKKNKGKDQKSSWWKSSQFNPGDKVTLKKNYKRPMGNPRQIPAGTTAIIKGYAYGDSYLDLDINGTSLMVAPNDVEPVRGVMSSWWKNSIDQEEFDQMWGEDEEREWWDTDKRREQKFKTQNTNFQTNERVSGDTLRILSLPERPDLEGNKATAVFYDDIDDQYLIELVTTPELSPYDRDKRFNVDPNDIELWDSMGEDDLEKLYRNSWWKSSDPYLDDQGYMNFEQGEENWFNNDFRVGDSVMLLDTGEQGMIDENNGDGTFSVRTELGDNRTVEMSNLQKVDAEPMEDPQYQDLQRFQGGDPEAQDWEDPTFNLSGYIDDDVYELMVGDQIVLLWVDTEDDAPLVNQEGEVVDVLADGYVVEVQGSTFNVVRDQIELRPVEANPHYGNDVEASRVYSMKTAAAQKTVRVTPKTLEEAGLSFQDMVDRVQWFYDNSSEEDYEGGVTWYKSVHDLCQQMAQTSAYSFEQLIAIFAVLSPNVEWKLNHTAALTVIEHYKQGDSGEDYKTYPFPKNDGTMGKCPGYPANYEKAYRILGNNDLTAVGGEKVGAFYENFRDGRPLGEGEDQDMGVTIDIWATRIVINRPNVKIALSDPANALLQKVYQQVAQQSGLLPKQVQAVTWVSYKRHKGKLSGAPEPVDLPIVSENAPAEEPTPVTSSWWVISDRDLTPQEFDHMWGEEPQEVINSGMSVYLVQDPSKTGTVLNKTPGGKLWVDFDDGSSGSFNEHELEINDPLERQFVNSWWR